MFSHAKDGKYYLGTVVEVSCERLEWRTLIRVFHFDIFLGSVSTITFLVPFFTQIQTNESVVAGSEF